MKQKQMTAIAIACGMVCALCVGLFMMSVQGEADAARAEVLSRYGGEQVEACVATRDIVAGERVDLSAVETKLWVADLLPDQALRNTADAVGKTATSTIFKGEVITSGRFDAGHDALDVPAGKQAVSVPAKAVQAVGGAIRPGMSVDIYSAGDSATTAIARNVNVLDASVGSSSSLTSSENGWITLAVEPERVQELIAASNKTTLYFTLPGATVDDGDAVQQSSDGQQDEQVEQDEPHPAERPDGPSIPSPDSSRSALDEGDAGAAAEPASEKGPETNPNSPDASKNGGDE